MALSTKFDELHIKIRGNKWLWRFSIFTRIALAAGFIPSGMQKVLGERFTVLVANHPMGHYLNAVYQTGFYYTFIGTMQVLAAVLLLIPRTATLGVIIYFPIILNICIVSLAVRFDGSMITSPLMTFGCIYLFIWDYHKFRFLLPFKHKPMRLELPEKRDTTNKFPFAFFGLVLFIGASVVILTQLYELKPRNTLNECAMDCEESVRPEDCMEFCECIHVHGKSLEDCLEIYEDGIN
jgi:hypothetical protein